MLIIEMAFRWEQMNFSITEMLLYIDISAQKEVLCVYETIYWVTAHKEAKTYIIDY